MRLSIASDKKLLVFIAVWWLVCMSLAFLILRNSEVDAGHSAVDSISSIVLLAGCCFFSSNNMRFYIPRKDKYWYILVTSLAVSGLWLLLQQLFMWGYLKSGDTYLLFIKSTWKLRFGAAFLLTTSINMLSLLWYSQQEQKAYDDRKSETEKITRDAELYKLRQQLQPHFLFNSLNSISALTGSQPEKARHMIQQLSDFLRGTLKKEEQQWIQLSEEIQYVQLYLDIEKVRFGHRLQAEIIMDSDATGKMIPAMLLQPIVENAIKFGLYDTIGDVVIRLYASSDEQQLMISVSNPFDEETSVSATGTGFGLTSIRRRLFLLFARQDLLITRKENKIFTTTIFIPQLYEGINNR